MPSFPSSLICDTKTKRETDELRKASFCHPRSFRRRLRTDLRYARSFSIIARRREAEEEPIARARARVFFFSSLLFTRAIFTNENKRRKKRQSARAQVNCFLVRDRSERSQINKPTSFIVHHHRSTLGEETEEEEKPRVVFFVVVVVFFESAHLLVFISVLGALYLSLSKKSARIFYTR